MMITICSSVDFTPQLLEIKKTLEAKGYQVNIPFFSQQIEKGELTMDKYLSTKEQGGDISLREHEEVDFFRRYWDFIKSSDAILVLNLEKKGIKGYIGGNTLMEMGFAYGQGKKIYLYNPIPARSERMHYVDEIIDLKPIVINGNLDLL